MQKLYASTDKYDDMGVNFYFHAKNQKDANSKMIGWNRYQGFCDSPGWGWHIAVEVKNPEEINPRNIHDNYV